MWEINILTLFPEIFPGPLAFSVTGRAIKRQLISIHSHSLRDYAVDKHKKVDAPPYGGGGGMVIKADVIGRAIEDLAKKNPHPIIYLSPRGEVFNQGLAIDLAAKSGLNILCGRFEGIDERAIKEYRIREVSLGDFLLSSGDVAAIPLIDACARLIPGVLDNADSLYEESFGLDERYRVLLEYPHYTKPYEWKNRTVPDVLLSGNHQLIKDWRLREAEEKTKAMRPDLWNIYLGK